MKEVKLVNFINEKSILLKLKTKNKKGVIEEMVKCLINAGLVTNKNKLVNIILKREALGTTGIGDRVAIPHGTSSLVKEIIIAFGRADKGIDFDSLDNKPVNLFFMLLFPEEKIGPHLKLLARLSRLLRKDDFRNGLTNAATANEVIKFISYVEKDMNK